MTSDQDNTPPTGVDLEILARDIQSINSADAVVGFFRAPGLQYERSPENEPGEPWNCRRRDNPA